MIILVKYGVESQSRNVPRKSVSWLIMVSKNKMGSDVIQTSAIPVISFSNDNLDLYIYNGNILFATPAQ